MATPLRAGFAPGLDGGRSRPSLPDEFNSTRLSKNYSSPEGAKGQPRRHSTVISVLMRASASGVVPIGSKQRPRARPVAKGLANSLES
jgi:hypothetical protein